MPNWREIGDHCRHLSRGFVADILFPHCDVALVGPSLQQGGDNLNRYALHIRKTPGATRTAPVAQLDLREFLKALAVSDTTIQDKYPIKAHMNDIIRLAGDLNAPVAPDQLAALAGLVKAEISYCTKDWAQSVVISDASGSDLYKMIAD